MGAKPKTNAKVMENTKKPIPDAATILGVMCRIQHPEAYYQTAAESRGMPWRSMTHQEIIVWKASLLRTEAEAIIAFSQDEGPTFDIDATVERVMNMMKATDQPQHAPQQPVETFTREDIVAFYDWLVNKDLVEVVVKDNGLFTSTKQDVERWIEQRRPAVNAPQQPDGDGPLPSAENVKGAKALVDGFVAYLNYHKPSTIIIATTGGYADDMRKALQLLTPSNP